MKSLREIAGAFQGKAPAFDYCTIRVQEKWREIAVPNDAMRSLHRRLNSRLRQIEGLDVVLMHSYGALGGGSVVMNAACHAHNRYFYTLDLNNAYPTTPLDAVASVLAYLDPELGSIAEIEIFLRAFCSGRKGGLAVGGPASPLLFDAYCSIELDHRMREWFPEATYTRYLDDLTFSQSKPIPSIMRRRIREVVEVAGYSANRRKSHVIDRLNQPFGKPLTVTGVVITPQGDLRPTEEFLKEVRILLRKRHLAEQEQARLQGLSGHLMQFRPGQTRERVFDLLDWTVSMDVRHLQASLIRRFEKPDTAAPIRVERKLFSREYLDELLGKVPIEEVARRYVKKLKKFGNEYTGCCPFHREKTASFTVIPHRGFYYCFGCGSSGDAIRLVQELDHVPFPAAVRDLASQYW